MKKGILLPIFSLPSKYGIGDFGYEAYEFIDILSNNKIDFWEVLPINSCIDSPNWSWKLKNFDEFKHKISIMNS